MTDAERIEMEIDFDVEFELMLEALESETRYQMAAVHQMMARIMADLPIKRTIVERDD